MYSCKLQVQSVRPQTRSHIFSLSKVFSFSQILFGLNKGFFDHVTFAGSVLASSVTNANLLRMKCFLDRPSTYCQVICPFVCIFNLFELFQPAVLPLNKSAKYFILGIIGTLKKTASNPAGWNYHSARYGPNEGVERNPTETPEVAHASTDKA